MLTSLQKKLKMQDELDLYEYAVIRLVPHVERGEFMNVGLAMFCRKKRWLQMDFHIREELFEAFCPNIELAFIKKNLIAFQEIANGKNVDSLIAHLEAPDRFRWLVAVRSSVIQTSSTHVGLTTDLEKTFQKILTEQIGINNRK